MTQVTIDILGLTLGQPKGTDNYPAVDTTDLTTSPIGTTKRYLINDLYAFILNNLGVPTYPSVIASTTGNLNATYADGPVIGNPGVNATLTDASGTFLPLFLDSILTQVGSFPYLIKNQLNPAQNGIYYLAQQGDSTAQPWKLIRVPYFNQPSNVINNSIIRVSNGTINANTTWQLTFVGPVIVGLTALNFTSITANPSIFPIINGGFPVVFNAVGPTNLTLPTSGTLATVGSIFPWINVTVSPQTMAGNTGYVVNASPTIFVLPAVAAVGDILFVMGNAPAGWTITQNAGQQINYGILSTTVGVGGSLASTQRYDSVFLVCVAANTRFNVLSNQGNLTVV